LLGILSTYWRKLHRPDGQELSLIDLLVRQAADLIEVARAEEALRTTESTLRSFYETGFSVAHEEARLGKARGEWGLRRKW
jgi:hypothetical protein